LSAGSRPQLLQAFEFTEDDLNANRQGKMSSGQRDKLDSFRKARRMSLIAYAVMAGLLVLGCIGAGLYMAFTRQDPTIRMAVPLALGFATLLMLGGSANFYLRTRDVLNGTVSQAEGQARLFSRTYRDEDNITGTGWFLKLDGKEFRLVNEAQYQALEEGRSYRVYYVRGYPFNFMLSVDAL